MHSEETNMMIRKVRRINEELQNYKLINFGLREHIKKTHSKRFQVSDPNINPSSGIN